MKKNHLKVRCQLNYSEKIRGKILELVKEYNLELDPKLGLAERIKIKNPKIVIFNLARRILNREGSFKDISAILKKDLRMHQKDAEKLAHDIKNEIVPLADIIQEGPEEEKEAQLGPSVQELLIEKIKKGVPRAMTEELKNETPAVEQSSLRGKRIEGPLGVKKVEVKDVDESAEKLKKKREETARPGTTGGELQRKNQPDKYRELIE